MGGRFLFFLLGLSFSASGQLKIHSHNDYAKEKPLIEAYQNKVEEIEADIFLVNGKLIVAHSRKEIDTNKTLDGLYLTPIANFFKQFNGQVSADKKYTFSLMIDVKDNWNATYPMLKENVERYGEVFNRAKNKLNIQIIVSGNRPPDSTFHTYPDWVYFDGLPTISYAKKDLKRVALISDNFAKVSKWKGTGELPVNDVVKLTTLIIRSHQMKKPFRFWGAPDHQLAWRKLMELGVDVINTDNVAECRTVLSKLK